MCTSVKVASATLWEYTKEMSIGHVLPTGHFHCLLEAEEVDWQDPDTCPFFHSYYDESSVYAILRAVAYSGTNFSFNEEPRPVWL